VCSFCIDLVKLFIKASNCLIGALIKYSGYFICLWMLIYCPQISKRSSYRCFRFLNTNFWTCNTFAFNFASLQMNERSSYLSELFQAVYSLCLGAVFEGRVQQGRDVSSNATLPSIRSIYSVASSCSVLQCIALVFT